jgi:hypothetical protein
MADIPELIADLKITVVQGHIRQIIEHSSVSGALTSITSTLTHVRDKIDEIHVEVVKHKRTEMLEMLGLDMAAAVHEKYQEAQVDKKVAWWDWLTAGLLSIIPLILIPALALYFKGAIINMGRKLQTWRPGGDNSPDARGARTILTTNADGGLGRETLDAVNQRELRKWNGGAGLADIPADANFDGLRRQLQLLNPKMNKFNALAPDFVTNFRKLPSERAMTKAATGVGKVADAVEKVKPDDVETLATAIGKLATSQENFNPRKLPKARGLASAATEAERLAKAGDAVKLAFENLKAAAQSAERVIAAT